MTSARTFEPASVIVDYIKEERKRCADLVELLSDKPERLLDCIKNGVWPDEIATLKIDDDFEDLM